MDQLTENRPITAVLLNDTSSTTHLGCKLVVEQIYKQAEKAGIEIIHSVKIPGNWQDPEHIAKIDEADIVIVNGEGTIHHGRSNAMRLVSCARYCRDRGKKAYLINSVYQDNNAAMAHDVRLFDLVFVRESASQAELKDIGVPAQVVPDMIFGHDDLFDESAPPDNGPLLLTNSAVNAASYRLYKLSQDMAGASFVTVRCGPPVKKTGKKVSLPRRIARTVKATLKAIIFPDRNTWKNTPNDPALDRIIEELYYDRSHILGEIAGAKLVVTGLFHMTCLALIARRPVFAVASNTHKIEGTLGDAGLLDKLLDLSQVTEGGIKGLQWTEADFQKRDRFIADARKKISGMFAQIHQSAVMPQQGAHERSA